MNVVGGWRRGVGETTSTTVETLRGVEVGQRGADSANIVGWLGSTYGCGEYDRCCAVCIVDVVCVVDVVARSFWVLLAHLMGDEFVRLRGR